MLVSGPCRNGSFREFDIKEAASDPDSGTDDDMIDVLEDNGRDPMVRYLLGEPMLGDLLAEGLGEFGLSWSDERTTPIQ